MPEDASIKVQAGGSLVIDGGVITKSCEDLWQGIEVWGQGSGTPHPTIGSILGGTYPSTFEDHGVVYLKEGSTIEYARNGITTSKYDDLANPSYRGGIIVAHGANFINCRRSVEFMQYDYGTPQIDDDNVSEFYRCNFEVNADYPCEEVLFAHVSMWDVDGVLFIANIFSDLRAEECKNEARGIYSIDATYTVASYLCGGATPCDEVYGNFVGIYRGIQAENAAYRPLDVVVSDILFDDNYRGILLSNVDNSLIMSNSFAVPDISGPSNNAYGIYLEDCTGYHIENNSFTTTAAGYDDASPYNAGMYVVNNSNAQSEVYRNTFSDLEAGIRVQTNNSKLQIKCNTFNDIIEKHDIYVTNTGELGDQGKCLPADELDCDRVNTPAGNKFLNNWTNNTCDIKIFDGHPELKYKHHTGADYTPTWYTTGPTTFVNPIPCTYSDNLGDCFACQSKLPEGGSGYRMNGETTDQTAYALYQDLLAVKAQIQILEDEIITEALEYTMDDEPEVDPKNETLDYLTAKLDYLVEEASNQYILENKSDSAIAILGQADLEWTERRTIDIYLMTGDTASASTALNPLPTDDPNNADYKTLTQFKLAILSDSLGWDNMSTTQKVLLQELAGKQTKSGVAAENILHFAEGIDFEEVFDPDEISPRLPDPIPTDGIRMYPNPANSELYIDLVSFDELARYEIRIFCVTGTQVFSSQLSGNSLHVLDLTNLQTSLLFVQILRNDIPIYTEKIMHL